MCQKKYITDTAPAVKYFLAQARGSILLFRFVLGAGYWLENNNINIIRTIVIISIAVKSGTPPFHF
jgi:hypothetical protein